MKRVFDVVVSGFGLLVSSPVLAVVALLLWITEGRPVFFSQVRVGRRGEPFRIHKFRTMRSGDGLSVTADGDSRIHAVGQFLRAYKLDELPQLVNVLRGEMSLVGPRPEVPAYLEHWSPAERDRILSVRPGITDPASIAYRHESEVLAASDDPERTYLDEIVPAKVAMYVDYVDSRSLLGDIRILVDTVRAVAQSSEDGRR